MEEAREGEGARTIELLVAGRPRVDHAVHGRDSDPLAPRRGGDAEAVCRKIGPARPARSPRVEYVDLSRDGALRREPADDDQVMTCRRDADRTPSEGRVDRPPGRRLGRSVEREDRVVPARFFGVAREQPATRHEDRGADDRRLVGRATFGQRRQRGPLRAVGIEAADLGERTHVHRLSGRVDDLRPTHPADAIAERHERRTLQPVLERGDLAPRAVMEPPERTRLRRARVVVRRAGVAPEHVHIATECRRAEAGDRHRHRCGQLAEHLQSRVVRGRQRGIIGSARAGSHHLAVWSVATARDGGRMCAARDREEEDQPRHRKASAFGPA